MPTPSDYLLYGSILIAIALGFIVAALVILYVRLLREHERLRQEKVRMSELAQKEAEDILSKAQKSAEILINDAHLKAGEIIKKTELLTSDSKNKMLAELEEVSRLNIENFRNALSSAKKDMVSVLDKVSVDLKSQALTEVSTFRGSLQKEIVSSQEALSAAVSEGYKKIEEEIGKYKVARLRQVDDTIFEILREVTQKIIGRAISFEEHEELVKKSLEEAKRENIF
jgi:F0F1-type ATP synthase membrane subunit b/b'